LYDDDITSFSVQIGLRWIKKTQESQANNSMGTKTLPILWLYTEKEGIYPHNSTQLEIFVTEQTHNYSSKIAPKYTH
jgi:hypothetical protein